MVVFAFGFIYQAKLPREVQPAVSELIFSHMRHVVDEELECADCHADVESSVSGVDNLLPDMAVCSDCHDVEDEDECATCHSDTDDPQIATRIEDYSQKFSHEVHLTADLDCANCHAGIAQKESVEPYLLPTMVACLDCHEQQSVSNQCLVCHTTNEDLRPASHGPAFLHDHADLAESDQSDVTLGLSCQSCHDTSYCEDCHDGDNVDRFTHPLNFVTTHALDAQSQERTCATCHTAPTFCEDCHRDNLLLPQNHRPGWVNALDGGRHAIDAMVDIETCISCHESNAEQICQPCHN